MNDKHLHHIFTIVSLIEKHMDGTLTAEEQKNLFEWLSEPANKALLNDVLQPGSLEKFEESYQSIDTLAALTRFKKRYELKQRGKTVSIFKWVASIASLIAIVWTFGWLMYERKDSPTELGKIEYTSLSHDIEAGGNRALLTLADGRTISLSEGQEGILIKNGEITYQDGLTEVMELSDNDVEEFVLTTPRGGTYAVTLPDGTKVRLNAGSTLKYPSRFVNDERFVELSGEAYFDVAKVEKPRSNNREPVQIIPFKVKTKGQLVEVLGTEFNICGYDDESDVRTTLVEGSVRLRSADNYVSSVVLKPGQQGIVRDDNTEISVRPVDTEIYTAWKDGFFYFNNMPVYDLMKQVEKWYDVEVEYKASIPKETFSGKIKRSTSLMGLLEILQVSTIAVKLQDKKLIVY
ncbi:FecR family protein [Sphingobacterium chuzhouense]|uniref:FecR domain-containing protein n=1 Tax=Sphingobacterium chuzhouense TaxID=1742264 RepID=A0ABR7XU53_9SPHI|nr:FecR family protein [Sphingobacterium chuzhouense]MBD1422342.1 FecR domain-containing protein [Sphingobacterium chuzhouense]